MSELNSNQIVIRRTWAMPNKITFGIKPIKELLEKYITNDMIVIDPFANNSKLGTITNDLNPEFDTDFNLDALEFLKLQNSNSADCVLFDPPYSITQASQCYKSFGADKLKITATSMKWWAECKNEITRIIKTGGIVICCGWTSNGLGLNRGYVMLEILLVPHGGSKNDTIVTVESLRQVSKRSR